MKRLATGLGLCAALLSPLAHGADTKREYQVVGERKIPVSNKTEITIKARSDQDVKNRELWYCKYDNDQWGAWQKHGLTFSRETPITWSPTEGHWRIYVRIEEVSSGMMSEPGPETKGKEFIIDRSAPAASITYPAANQKLRGGQKYTITWKTADPHLHSKPVTLKWSRDGKEAPTIIASALPNTGSYEWTTPMDMTASGHLTIESMDKANNIGTGGSTGIVIDAIAPSRNILGPTIVASQAVNLAVKATDAGPAGLASLQLFFSQDKGATWTPGPEITKGFESIAWKAPADGRYLLSLVATDQSGNATPRPVGVNGQQASLLVDTAKPVLTLASPIGVADANAKAGAAARRIFKPGDEVAVGYTLKETNPQSDGITIAMQTEEGGRWETVGKNLKPGAAFTFKLPNISTTTAKIKVTSVDVAGNVGEVIAGEAFRIDNKVESGEVDIDL